MRWFPRVFCRSAAIVALSVAAFAQPSRAASSDVDSILIAKAVMFLQLSPSDIFFEKSPYAFAAIVGGTAPGSIKSGSFSLAGSTPISLSPTDDTDFLFTAAFSTAAELGAAFPNGSYDFSLETARPPTLFTATVDLAPRFPSALPQLINQSWYSVVIQYDTRKDFTFFWNDFPDFSTDPAHPSFVQFQVADIYNRTLFTNLFQQPTRGLTFPAGFFQPGFYVGRLAFGHVDAGQLGSTSLADAGFMMTEFIISVVDGPPVITSPTSITVNAGQLFVYTVETTNGAGSFLATNLPPGVTYDAARGQIGGYPTTPGTYQVGMVASNSIGSGTATLTVNVLPAGSLAITSSTRAAGSVGDPFRFQVLAPGATSAARLTAIGLPPGLRADATSGEITGTPTVAGEYSVHLHVADGNAFTDGTLLITLNPDPAFPGIKSPTRASLTPGRKFSYTIDASPETVRSGSGFGTNATDDTTYSYVGTLPPGLNFDAKNGVISGTYQGNGQHIDSDPTKSRLSGGALVGNIQIFASNSRGTSTVPLVFFNSPVGAVNISTRMAIASGDNVLIGGFIVTGNAPKKLIVRALGPSLPVAGALQDPVLELHAADGSLLVTNDSWKSDHQQDVLDSGVAPTDDRECAIVAAFQPGNYTAIVRGKDGTTGVALVELYDLGTASIDASSDAKLANISTRGLIQTGDNVMIGGFIISQVQSKVLVRAIGPSLAKAGVANALSDTLLELHGADGQIILSNDDWQSSQEQQIRDTGVPPTDARESALVATINPGNYTAIVRGKNNATGVGLVEIYALQ